jgi:hypothetical protein
MDNPYESKQKYRKKEANSSRGITKYDNRRKFFFVILIIKYLIYVYMLIERQKISSIKKSNKVLYFILTIYD